MKTKATKLTRMLAGVLLAAVTIVSVIGGSITDVNAKTSRCKTGIYVAGKFYSYKTTKTINLTMCKGCTSNYSVEFGTANDKFNSGDQPFKIEVIKAGSVIVSKPSDPFNGVEYFREKHKVTITSSNPSVVSVKSTLTGNKAYLDAKECGTATITAKASCGNKYKIKVTVKDHSYKKTTGGGDGEVGLIYYKYCSRCGKTEVSLTDPNWNPTEEEIYQKMMDIAGEKGGVVYGDESWRCDHWTNWTVKKIWGITGGNRLVRQYGKEVKDFSKARCGDIIYMSNHVAMVVKNHHDGYLELAGNAVGELQFGLSDEEYESNRNSLNDGASYATLIVPYSQIEKIYTLYKD